MKVRLPAFRAVSSLALALWIAACNGSTSPGNPGSAGNSGSAGATGGTGATGGAGATGSAGATGGAGASGSLCGFIMPNPAGAALPNPAAYTMNADGTVTDNVTGFTWEGTVDPGSYTQANADAHCTNKGGGWRLPTRLELVSLVDFTVAYPGPAINQTYFPNTPAAPFWTSSPDAGLPGNAWTVDFTSGDTSSHGSDGINSLRLRCVQAPAPKCHPTRYQVEADTAPAPGPGVVPPPGVFLPGPLVHDVATGLTWQQKSPQARPWTRAMSYCAALGTGWRLPSLTELQTIVDDARANPAMDAGAFPNEPSDSFWSSASAGGPGFAWFVNFQGGVTSHSFVVTTYRVRCVR